MGSSMCSLQSQVSPLLSMTEAKPRPHEASCSGTIRIVMNDGSNKVPMGRAGLEGLENTSGGFENSKIPCSEGAAGPSAPEGRHLALLPNQGCSHQGKLCDSRVEGTKLPVYMGFCGAQLKLFGRLKILRGLPLLLEKRPAEDWVKLAVRRCQANDFPGNDKPCKASQLQRGG